MAVPESGRVWRNWSRLCRRVARAGGVAVGELQAGQPQRRFRRRAFGPRSHRGERLLQPGASFPEMALQVPEPPQGGGQEKVQRRLLLPAPVQRAAEVGKPQLQLLQPFLVVGPAQVGRRLEGKRAIVHRVAAG
jgi:hypothetical protein